jgi:hypothetical protein
MLGLRCGLPNSTKVEHAIKLTIDQGWHHGWRVCKPGEGSSESNQAGLLADLDFLRR